jgi:predicted RNase H-like nuclease (RuvC/YqgF family)
MPKKFEYNFTKESELSELRSRVGELEEENSLLKESLEELIRVNTELTESIEEFNQGDMQGQQVELMAHTIEELNSEVDTLRAQLENRSSRQGG